MDPREDQDDPAGGGRDADALGADRFEHLASPEAGWAVPGVTGLGAGRDDDGDGDSNDGASMDAGRFGGSQASEDPDRFLGCDALALLDELEGLNRRLSVVVASADAHACRRLAERLTPVLRALEATYDRAIGQAAAGGGFASAGHGTARTWLADATNVTRTAAGGVLADAEFLDRQPEISTARDAGGMSWQHVAVFRKTLTAQPWREARFPQVAEHFVTVATGVDPAELRRHLQGWAQAVDDQEAPDRPDTPYVERALHLRQVGELWDVRGTLPMVEGATLAGVLDEVIAAARRKACTCGQDPCSCPKDLTPRATKRADALSALANWATAHRTCLHDDPLLSAGGAQRSRPTILVPLDRLAPHQVPATLADYFASHPPTPRTPHTGCTNCGHHSNSSGGSSQGNVSGRGSASDQHGDGCESGGLGRSGQSGRADGGGQGARHGSGSGHPVNSDPTAIEGHNSAHCPGTALPSPGQAAIHGRNSTDSGLPTGHVLGACCPTCAIPTQDGQNSASCTHTTAASHTGTDHAAAGDVATGATAADGFEVDGVVVGDTANDDDSADGATGGVIPAGTETANGVRFTARELNEALASLGVSQVRWYAGSESGTLNRRDTEVELCDATVARIITSPEGYPLDVGHDTRVINPGLRAALIARDGGCVIPGCVTPATWCDGHHVIHWAAGGITALSNLALTCREHHRAIHAGQWSITFTEEGLPQAKSRDIRNLHPYRRHRRP